MTHFHSLWDFKSQNLLPPLWGGPQTTWIRGLSSRTALPTVPPSPPCKLLLVNASADYTPLTFLPTPPNTDISIWIALGALCRPLFQYFSLHFSLSLHLYLELPHLSKHKRQQKEARQPCL